MITVTVVGAVWKNSTFTPLFASTSQMKCFGLELNSYGFI